MKRIEPRPTLNSFIIVPTNPFQGFKVTSTDIIFQFQKFTRRYFKLLLIIFFFVVIESVIKNWILIQIKWVLFVHFLHDSLKWSNWINWIYLLLYFSLSRFLWLTFVFLTVCEISIIHFSLFIVGFTNNHLSDKWLFIMSYFLYKDLQALEIYIARVGNIAGHKW